jgi:hypothetical protein
VSVIVKTLDEDRGSTANARIERRPAIPTLDACQRTPAFVLLKAPPVEVPA